MAACESCGKTVSGLVAVISFKNGLCRKCFRERAKSAEAIASPAEDSGKGSRVLHLLFSFRGRINRFEFLTACLALCLLYALSRFLFVLVDQEEFEPLPGVVYVVFGVLLIWIYGAILTKRLHDINWSGLWLLCIVVPFLLYILSALLVDQTSNSLASQYERQTLYFVALPLGLLMLAQFFLFFRRGTPALNRFGALPESGPYLWIWCVVAGLLDLLILVTPLLFLPGR